jgi:hypothetical protein
VLIRFRWNRMSRPEKFMDAVCLANLEQRNKFESPTSRNPPEADMDHSPKNTEIGALT